MTFECDGCGLCCKTVGSIIESAKILHKEGRIYNEPLKSFIKEMMEFPYECDETGTCKQLDKNNKCKVYSTRPDSCNVDTMFNMYRHKFMTREECYKETHTACNKLKGVEQWKVD